MALVEKVSKGLHSLSRHSSTLNVASPHPDEQYVNELQSLEECIGTFGQPRVNENSPFSSHARTTINTPSMQNNALLAKFVMKMIKMLN